MNHPPNCKPIASVLQDGIVYLPTDAEIEVYFAALGAPAWADFDPAKPPRRWLRKDEDGPMGRVNIQLHASGGTHSGAGIAPRIDEAKLKPGESIAEVNGQWWIYTAPVAQPSQLDRIEAKIDNLATMLENLSNKAFMP